MDIPIHRTLVLRIDAKTPLREMTASLMERFGTRRSVLAGAAYFTGFPVIEAIVDGLLVLHLAVAKKRELVLVSSHQLMGEVAPSVDRLVQAGIVLVHGSGIRAARAFENRVIRPCLYGDDPEWRIRSAKFFAELVRTAREAGDRWAAEMHALDKLAEGSARLAGMRLSHSVIMQSQQVVAWLKPDGRLGRQHPSSAHCEDHPDQISKYCDQLTGMDQYLAERRDRLEMLNSLPFDLCRLPEDVLSTDEMARMHRTVTIEFGWMIPALVLAMVNFDERRQYMTIAEWSVAVRKRDSWTDDEIVDSVMRYLVETRKWRVGRWCFLMKKFLREYLIHQFRAVASHLGVKMMQESLMQVSLEALEYDPRSALAIARGEEFDPAQSIEGIPERDRKWHYVYIVVPAMPWETITLDVFQEIVARGNIPVDCLVGDLERMPKDRRVACVDWLLGSIHVTERAVAELVHLGHYEPDLEFMVRRPDLLPEDCLAPLIGQCFEEHNKSARELLRPGDILKAIQRLTIKREFENILTAREYRREISSMFDEWLDKAGPSGYWEVFIAFRDRAKAAGLWNQIVVGADARIRFSSYGSGFEGSYMPPWGHWAEDTGLNDPLSTLDVEREDLVLDIYAMHDELGTFSWLHEGNPDRVKLVKEYDARREAYYRRHGYPAIDND